MGKSLVDVFFHPHTVVPSIVTVGGGILCGLSSPFLLFLFVFVYSVSFLFRLDWVMGERIAKREEGRVSSTIHLDMVECNHLILGAPTEIEGALFQAGEYRLVDGTWVKMEDG